MFGGIWWFHVKHLKLPCFAYANPIIPLSVLCWNVWSLHVLPVSARVRSGSPGFLPQPQTTGRIRVVCLFRPVIDWPTSPRCPLFPRSMPAGIDPPPPPATPQGLRVGGNPNGWNAKRTHYVGRVTCLYLTFLLTDNLYPFHMRQTQTPQLDFGKVRTTQFSIRHREHLSAANLQANLSSCAPRLKCFPQEWVSAVDHFNVICVVHTHVICNMVT